mgnify:CR=1 FL=1
MISDFLYILTNIKIQNDKHYHESLEFEEITKLKAFFGRRISSLICYITELQIKRFRNSPKCDWTQDQENLKDDLLQFVMHKGSISAKQLLSGGH